eukprot:6208613-Pleurochrysis_carterae.AAC.3
MTLAQVKRRGQRAAAGEMFEDELGAGGVCHTEQLCGRCHGLGPAAVPRPANRGLRRNGTPKTESTGVRRRRRRSSHQRSAGASVRKRNQR